MPDPITIQYLSGPSMGRRQKFTQPPVSFGRDADNVLVLAEPFVSRHHGSLVLDDRGRWCLANHSTNGTRINARLITATEGKPRRLHDGDTITVGNQPVFTVSLEAAALDDDDQADRAALEPRKLSGRSKVWMGIGIYMLLMLGLFVFLATLGDAGGGASAQRPTEITPAELESEIRAALPLVQPPNLDAADRHLQEARSWYARRDIEVVANFRAHDEYKRSLASANLIAFEQGLDQQRFLEVQDALVIQIEGMYRQGFNQLMAGNHDGAVRTFDRLLNIYTDKDSSIYKSALAMRDHASSLRRKRR